MVDLAEHKLDGSWQMYSRPRTRNFGATMLEGQFADSKH